MRRIIVGVLVITGALGFFACDDAPASNADGGAAGAGGTAGTGGAAGGGGVGGGAGGTGGAGASCESDEGCPPGSRCDVALGECRPACDAGGDCGSSAICVGGFCDPLESCARGQDCPAETTCSCRGVCEPMAGAACAGDLGCAPTDYCDACTKTCVPRVAPCGACTDSAACERRQDVCHPVGAEGQSHCLRACTGQANCDGLGPGYRCEDLGTGRTACVPESADCRSVAGCNADAECPSRHFCNDRQQCQPGCVEDTGCPEGMFCQGVRCAPPCAVDADCGPNASCDAEGHCGVPPGGCLSSVDCLVPETYCDLEQQICVPGCERDNDCLNANMECIANDCRVRGCSGNFQCAFGEVCDLETAVCELAVGRHCEADCDPMDEASCGDGGQRCLSLQDEDENPLGDFCFEPCAETPNECPQGYQCIDLEDQSGNVTDRLCVRRCDLDPFR